MNTMMALGILPTCASMGDIEDLQECKSSANNTSLFADTNYEVSDCMFDLTDFCAMFNVPGFCQQTKQKASCLLDVPVNAMFSLSDHSSANRFSTLFL